MTETRDGLAFGRNRDIIELFDRVPVGTPVVIEA